jgi:ribose transport system permease protein
MAALAATAAAREHRRRPPPVAALLLAGSVLVFIVTALATGQTSQLSIDGVVGLLQRMAGLGLVALGQTFVIIAGSIDLSVANLISVAAVGASFLMQGQVGNVPLAIMLVLAISVVVGWANGLIVTKLDVNPFIATLGVGLILQGLLSATFNNFAGRVPEAFQALAYGTLGPVPYSVMALFALAGAGAFVLGRTRFGAHLYAVGGNLDGARLAGVRTDRVRILAHILCSVMAGCTGLYLASRLRSGAPWVGRDGVYDLESVAVVVIGGTLLAGGRGGVWGTLAGVLLFSTLDAVFNMTGIDAFSKQILRGVIVIAAVAIYAVRSRGLAA